MKIILRMVLLIGFIDISFLNAYEFNKFKEIPWDWIAIALLVLLFIFLLISLIKDLRKNKKKIDDYIVNEKCVNKTNYNYINDINNSRIKSTSKLKNSVDSLVTKNNLKQKDEIKDIEKHYKEIFSTNKEEEIFLDVYNNKSIGGEEYFSINEFLAILDEYGLSNIKHNIDKNYILVGNKEIIADIAFLLSKIQINEHNFKEPKIALTLEPNSNKLSIRVDRTLPSYKNIKKILSNKIKPFYLKDDKKYHGVYIYLIQKLAQMINGNLKANVDKSGYTLEVEIPIEVTQEEAISYQTDMKLKNRKKALIITDKNRGTLLADYLKRFNFETTVKNIRDLNKEIPNFMDFDIVFMDTRLFEPILTDYLETIKQYSDLKIVALINKNNSLYPAKLVDEVIDLNKIEESLGDKLTKLYKDEMVHIKNYNYLEDKALQESKVSYKRGRVLIADDDITNLHILTYMIKKYGVEVVAHDNGEDVLKSLEMEHFDLVILDSIMPKLDGYETVKRIRENSKFNSVPVVIHSSFSIGQSSMEKIFELGFDSYLPKPFNKDDIEALLDRYVSNNENVNNIEVDKDDLKEFIAIYGDSDKILEKYIKEQRDEQSLSLLKDLKSIAKKINAKEFISSIEEIEKRLKNKESVDNSLIYALSNNLKELKSDIMKKLSA